MSHLILGALVIAVGLVLVIKSEWFLSNFGRIGFFDQHFGTSGGSRLGYKLVGMFTIFIGILIFINLIGGFLMWVLSPLLKYSRMG